MKVSGEKDERQDDLQRAGLSADQAQAWLAMLEGDADPEDGDAGDEEPGDPLAVWPENWPVLRVWLRLQTQWHLTPRGCLQGLRYDAATVVIERLMRGSSPAEQDQVFEHLVEMEHAAVGALDE